MKIKHADFYEAKLFMGRRQRYDGPEFSDEELSRAVADFQKSYPDEGCPPVRITPTRYVHKEYQEGGWELAVINYPRYDIPIRVLENFIMELAKHMLARFNQNKVSVVFPQEIYVLEADDAQPYHLKWHQ
jgi:hypothetical protein